MQVSQIVINGTDFTGAKILEIYAMNPPFFHPGLAIGF